MAITTVQAIGNEGGPQPTQVHSVAQAFGSNVTAGNAIIAFNTLSDFAGTHVDLQCTDSLTNTYALLDQENSNAGGGAATTASWLAVNVTGGADTVTNGFTSGGDVEDFQANFIIEVGGVAASPLIGHTGATQNGLAQGTDNILTGTVTVTSGQVPCRLYAIAMNTNGNSPVPAVGTGMTLLTNCWAFQSSPNTATIVYLDITVAGTYQGIFSQSSSSSSDITSHVIVLQGGATAPIITAQPTQQSAAVGATATYAVTATGATSYQWYLAPTIADLYGHVPGTFGSISGATSASYTTPTLTSADNGNWYYCAVTNGTGTTNTLPVRGWITGLGVAGKGQLFTAWVAQFKQLDQTSYSDMLARKSLQFSLDAQVGYSLWTNWLLPPSGTTATGSAALIEGVDTASGAGATSTSGSSALTEGHDAISGTGSTSTSGSLARTESSDTISATGATSTSGSATITEGADTSAGTGAASTSGSTALTESSDSVAATGVAGVFGSATITEASDVVAATGAPSTSGSSTLTEGHDTSTATGASSVSGSVSVTETIDTVAATGLASTSGSASLAENADVGAATGSTGTAGSGTIIEGHDTTSGVGSAASVGSAARTEAADTVAATGSGSTLGSGAIVEGHDAASASGAAARVGSASLVELHDVSVGVAIAGGSIASITEAHDALAAIGNAELMRYGYSTIDAPASLIENSTSYIDISYFSSKRVSFPPVGVSYRLDDVATGVNIVPWTSLTPGHTNEVKLTPMQNMIISLVNTREQHRVLFRIVDVFGNVGFASEIFTLIGVVPPSNGSGSISESFDTVAGHS